MKCSYFKSVWNILDILVIGIAIVCIAFSVYRTNIVDDKLDSLLKGGWAQGFQYFIIVYFLTAAGRLKRFSRHSACLKTKKSRNVNENAKDMNRREKIIEQIYIVECTHRYSKHVKCRLERFKRPAAVK